MKRKEKYVLVIGGQFLDPFYIARDNFSYVLMERYLTDPQHFRSKTNIPTKSERIIGYYSNLTSALKSLAKEKLYKRKKKYDSLQEYIDEWEKVTKEFEENINIKDL